MIIVDNKRSKELVETGGKQIFQLQFKQILAFFWFWGSNTPGHPPPPHSKYVIENINMLMAIGEWSL